MSNCSIKQGKFQTKVIAKLSSLSIQVPQLVPDFSRHTAMISLNSVDSFERKFEASKKHCVMPAQWLVMK